MKNEQKQSCIEKENPNVRLQLLPEEGNLFAIDWVQFLFAECTPPSSDPSVLDECKLCFHTHTVVLKGRRLRWLLPLIAKHEISGLKAISEKYESLVLREEPFICSIQVEKNS